ncbi:hypothetical protein Cgig2_009118 [Carnegiea gigantea]|uniref:Uncharacterized protein n=1 Tax=Carnegiea gigantea TaxID=171969 RepID=A0A9Q1GIN1_9CARY|nr:hypothetical protein Cgig2_009118 [Carnegiea gigantea]
MQVTQSQMVNIQLKLANYRLLLPPPTPLPSRCVFPRASFLPTTLYSNGFSPSLSLSSPKPTPLRVSHILPSFLGTQEEEEEEESSHDGSSKIDDLAPDSPVYQDTLRLVECSMFAAVAGLAYLLSNSLAIENYFGCFFALPIVVSSIRWGVAAGRKTMVATAVLLLVLSGPVKALTYLLMHGLLGFTMGSLWRLQVNWSLSIFICTLVRALGAVGYVLTSSFLIQENILGLVTSHLLLPRVQITVNLHAIITLIFNSLGLNTVPSMTTIYIIFSTLKLTDSVSLYPCGQLLLNCSCFVFLLHILYALFLSRLEMKASLRLPRWLANAL